MWPFDRKKKQPGMTLDASLHQLGLMGISLKTGVHPENILISLGAEATTLLKPQSLLCTLGGEAEAGEIDRYSDDVWHLDAECIEDNGSYVQLAERFMALAKGALPLTDLSDHVDLEAGEAWFEFTLSGKKERWTLTVENDWMAPEFYSQFQKLLLSTGSPKRFMICALGQDSLVLCGDEKLREAISKFSGLKFEWE